MSDISTTDLLRNTLDPDSAQRYATNLRFFKTFEREGFSATGAQQRLRHASVLMLGAGGVASFVLPALAGLGVGRVVVVDDDLVEAKNLTRQVLYTERDIGTSKVQAAVERLRQTNSSTEWVAVERWIRGPDDVRDLLDHIDLCVVGIDEPPEVDDWINQACMERRVPLIKGGLAAGRGMYYSVDPGVSPCWACFQHTLRRSEALAATSLSEEQTPGNPATAPTVSLVASLMALEALRYLTGFAVPVSAGVQTEIDMATGAQSSEPFPSDPGCQLCQMTGRLEAQEPSRSTTESDAPNPGTYIDTSGLDVVDVEDGTFIVARRAAGIFVSVPAIGAEVVRAFDGGATLAEGRARVLAVSGVNVDAGDLVAQLVTQGLLQEVGAKGDQLRVPADGDRNWIGWLPQGLADRMFSPAAWSIYALTLAVAVGLMAVVPAARPSWHAIVGSGHLGSIGLGVLLTTVMLTALGGLHEFWHGLGARAAGGDVRFSISRRWIFPVFQTDLSQLITLPRRRRYGPMLAGMAIDSVVLLAANVFLGGAHWHWWTPGPVVVALARAVSTATAVSFGFEFCVCMQTDVYAVMANWLACSNLMRVTQLTLLRRVRTLSAAQEQELARSAARDREVAAWYQWVCVAGGVLAALFAGLFFVPSVVDEVVWLGSGLAQNPLAGGGFWETLVLGTLTLGPLVWVAVVVPSGRLVRRGRSVTAGP